MFMYDTVEAELKVSTCSTAQGYVVQADGQFELPTMPKMKTALRDAIEEVVKAPIPVPLIVDLRQVDFIDSAGLALLVMAKKALIPNVGALHVRLKRGSQPACTMQRVKFASMMTLLYDED